MAEITEESTHRILVPALERDRNLRYPHRTTALSSVQHAPPGRVSHDGTALSWYELPYLPLKV